MSDSPPTQPADAAGAAAPAAFGADGISVRAWFLGYAVFLAVTCALIAILAGRLPWPASAWWTQYKQLLPQTSAALKLLVFLVYLSLCCTFLPMPTNWLVAAVATREAAVAAGVSDSVAAVALVTALVVGAVGGVASTIANLNDYHLFTLLLRHRGVARVRHTRAYDTAAKWFGKAPFFLLVLFNVIPIPVDVIRMLATSYRYPRGSFAVANFVGRFVRYAVIAFVTYWWDLGWVAVAALLGLAAVLAVGKGAASLFARGRTKATPAA